MCRTDSELTEWNKLKEKYQHLKDNILRAIEGTFIHKIVYADLKAQDPTLESRSISNISIKKILALNNNNDETKKRPDIVSYDITGGHVYEIKPISYLEKEGLAMQQLEKYVEILSKYNKTGNPYSAGGDLVLDTIMAPGVKNVTKTSYGATVTYWQNTTNGIIYYEVDYNSSLVRVKQTVEQTKILISLIILGGFLTISMNDKGLKNSFTGGY